MPALEWQSRRKGFKKVLTIILSLALGVAFGIAFTQFGFFENVTVPMWLVLPCLVLALFASIVIHELGHAVVGVSVGFRLNSLRVSRLQFDRPFRISWYRGKGTGAGGWTSLFPVKRDYLSARAIAMLLGGPLANLLTGALLFDLPISRGTFAEDIVCFSLFLGLLNLVPFRNRTVISDGGRILMLLRNRANGERWLAMVRLLEEMRTRLPENMSPEFIAKAIAIDDASPDTVSAHAIAYAAAFYQRKDDEAARLLEVCLRRSSLSSPLARTALVSDATVFQARRRKRADLAEQWLADLHDSPEQPWLRPRAEAALQEVRGDITGARAKLDEVETLITANPNQFVRELSLKNVRRWKDELATDVVQMA